MTKDADWRFPEFWRDRHFEWKNKAFYFVPLSCMLGQPKNLFETVQRLKAEIGTKEYRVKEDGLLLIETGLLKGRLLLEIHKPDNYDANVWEMEPSKLVADIHEGPMKTIKETAKKVQEKVKKEKNVNATRTFYWDFRHGPALTGQRGDKFVVICQL